MPGIKTRTQISAVLAALKKPVNVLVGMKGFDIPLAELESMGVRRISTGGSVMCATLGLVRKAVSDLGIGKLDYLDGMIPHAEIKGIFADLANREA